MSFKTENKEGGEKQTPENARPEIKPVASIWLKKGQKVDFMTLALGEDLKAGTNLIIFPYKNKKVGVNSPDFIAYADK